MTRRATLAFLSLLFAGRLLAPAPAAASTFTPLWTLAGWDYVLEFGNTDSDSQPELFFASKTGTSPSWTGSPA